MSNKKIFFPHFQSPDAFTAMGAAVFSGGAGVYERFVWLRLRSRQGTVPCRAPVRAWGRSGWAPIDGGSGASSDEAAAVARWAPVEQGPHAGLILVPTPEQTTSP